MAESPRILELDSEGFDACEKESLTVENEKIKTLVQQILVF
jgi:hypothetical protein